MRSTLFSRPAVVVAGAFVLLSALLLAEFGAMGTQASLSGGMDAMSIDLDVTGNTATSLGPLESCVEASQGDTVTLDVTALNIPAGFEMIAFAYTVYYDEVALTIATDDEQFLLAANFPSAVLDATQATPDLNGDGQWTGSAADLSAGPGESGSGVLSRLTMSVALDAPAGVYPLTLAGAGHVDSLNEGYAPDILNGGWIAVGVPCPSSESPTPSPAPTPSPPSPSPTPSLPLSDLTYASPAYLSRPDNYAMVTGSVFCPEPEQVFVTLVVSQWVKEIQVVGAQVIEQPCDGATPWTMQTTPISGRFSPGDADILVTAEVSGSPALGKAGTIRLKPGSLK
jgi:hypothetical protein